MFCPHPRETTFTRTMQFARSRHRIRVAAWCAVLAFATCAGGMQLRVSDNGRFLLNHHQPFFWLGDTAWLLFTRSPAEIDRYLTDRAGKGFNMIQCMALRTQPGGTQLVPNYRGDMPFDQRHPVQLNPPYWQHIDRIVDRANQLGIGVALVTMWGSNVNTLFPDPDQDNRQYARLLGERYRDRGNVVWIVVGEYGKIDNQWRTVMDNKLTSRDLTRLRSIAWGLESGHEGANLMTIHPIFTSSKHFHTDRWLDFNMQQTWGHTAPNIVRIRQDYDKQPIKPVLNGEPGYENRPEHQRGRMTPWHLRLEAYWSVFSGAFGFTYGAHHLWQFDDQWQQALQYEGASQMQYLRRLIESRPMEIRIPGPTILARDTGSVKQATAPCATVASDGSYALIYSPQGLPITADLGKIAGTTTAAWWYNPRAGGTHDGRGRPASRPFASLPTNGTHTFTPPTSGPGNDWVLVLDRADHKFAGPPGQRVGRAVHTPRRHP